MSRPRQYREFWNRYLQQIRAVHPEWRGVGATTERNYLYQSSPIPDCRIGPCFKRNGRLGHELVIMSSDPTRNAELYSAFRDRQMLFELTYGRRLTWDEVSNSKRYLIGDYRDGAVERVAETNDYISWLIGCGERLRAAVGAMPTDL